MHELEYGEVQDILTSARAVSDAPEAHGTLTGALCAAVSYGLDDWLGELFTDGSCGPLAEDALRKLFDNTRTALISNQMEFAVLLPDDEEPLVARAAALGQWCQGFLYGLGTSSIRNADDLPEQIGEAVRDLTAITQVGVDANESEEANEQAYAELVEFVRVGVQLLFDELAPYRVLPKLPPDVPLH
jgi:uncharacterized protein YgfB (UPF0149 family)